jgi:hypothetical protein
MEVMTREAMEQANSIFSIDTKQKISSQSDGLDLSAYLPHYGVVVTGIRQYGSSTLHLLKECIFDPAHTTNEAAIGKTSEGKLFYQCFHESCKGRTWQEARAVISGGDSLWEFVEGSRKTSLSYCPDPIPIERTETKNKNYQRSTEGIENTALDRDKQPFDPFTILKKGSDLMCLDIHVEWVIDKLIPKESITLFHGRGGIGKTWLSLILAHAVSRGLPFMGLDTVQCPVVYVDYENSLPVLVERVKKIQASDVLYWHNTNEMRPPKIDSKEWELYKTLPVGLLIYDTLRASQTKDENDSRQMAEVMNRLKELRDIGFTILLLHHTPKGNDQTYKGSTAILDLADHILSLHKVRKGNLEEVDDEETENVYYRFGTKGKTRYEPFHIFLEFQKEHGFVIAPDPDTGEMEEIHDLLINQKDFLKQAEVYDLVKTKLNIASKGKVIKLLNKGIGKLWETKRTEGRGRAISYCPIVQPLSGTKRTESSGDIAQTVDNTSLSLSPLNNNNKRTERTETKNDDDFCLEGEEIPDIPEVESWNN